MNWLRAIGGWLFGGGGASKVVDAVDDAILTEQERQQADQKDLESARTMQTATHGTWFDVLVDGMSRLVRPGVTLWLVGGFIGWWTLPRIETISEYWQNVFMLVLTFWFGGRAILKDLPSAIRMMRGK